MKKTFKSYAGIWAVLLAVFNGVVFLVRPIIPGFTIIYDARFWTAWGFITAAFAGNLLCAAYAFREENLKKLFYRLPLIRVSYTGVILMLVFGAVLMLIPNCPPWIAAVLCLLILAFTVIAVLKAAAASDVVEGVDKKVKAQTLFVKALTVDVEGLLARAATPEAKNACKKVFEAVRYSDPVSNDALAGVESQITLKFNEFSNAIKNNDECIDDIADKLIALVGERNRKCKVTK